VRNALTKGTPKWAKKNEHSADEGFALSLKGWSTAVDHWFYHGGHGGPRFVPYWWDDEGFHLNERYEGDLPLFTDECCTSTPEAHHAHSRNGRKAPNKKGFVCVSTEYRGATEDTDNRFISNYADFGSMYADAETALGRGFPNECARTLGELLYKPEIPEYERLDRLQVTASADLRANHGNWLQCVEVMCCAAISTTAATHTHTPPFMH
jgi:hypothetical protein